MVTRRTTAPEPPTEVSACLGADATDWAKFAAHWDDLVADSYAAQSS
ncbi:hypothetical protein [Streptomyces sp. NPDC008001]